MSRFTALWNSPWPSDCKVAPPQLPDFERWRINTNAGNKFNGDAITTFYSAGHFPVFEGMGPGGLCADGDWNCTKATSKFGGLPQLVNMTSHLDQLKLDIEAALPDANWSGVANIDWEAWKPAFLANRYNEYWIYINRSEALVAKTHPDWPADKVAKQAEADFNKASQEYWTASLRLCKKLRPNGVWGWYNYPIDSWNATFEDLGWLYDEVTALFPSIYLTTTNATLNRQYVDIALNKTKRVRDLHRKGGTRALPTYAFVWLDYDMPPFPKSTAGLLSPEDVQTELVRGATRWALDGVILWGSTVDARNATYCAGSYTTYVDQVAGPALLEAAKAADECAAARCSSHGKCCGEWDGCECDVGYGGRDCSSFV